MRSNINQPLKFLALITMFIIPVVWPSIIRAAPPTQSPPPNLLTAPPGVQEQPNSDPTIIRTRLVNVNFNLLGGDGTSSGMSAQSVQVMTLNLFNDVTFVAELDHIEPLATGGYAWIGTLQGIEFSQAIFVVMDGITAADIRLPGGNYQIRTAGDGFHVVREINDAAFVDHAPDYDEPPIDISETPQIEDIGIQADNGSIIDVMVAYSANARNGAGGTTAMQAFINLLIIETNAGYAGSLITPRLRLVHTYEVNYTESNNSGTDLTNLQGTSDGNMDEIHTKRNTYGADLIVLLLETLESSVCGRGNIYTGGLDTKAFSVVKRSCASGNLSFPHELGHNMGNRHDWYVDATTGNAPGGSSDNHGRVYTPGDWRTVMAYNTHCADAGTNCTRIAYFSNPSVSYLGQPTGFDTSAPTTCTILNLGNPDCEADNARVTNANALTIANYRQSRILAFIEKSVSTNSVLPGQPLTYTLVVTNLTSSTAANILITDTVPLSVVLNAGSLNGDATFAGTGPGSLITWTTGVSLSQNQSLSRTFVVTAANGGVINNTAYVSSTNAGVSYPSDDVQKTILSIAECGFTEGFESGALSSYWEPYTTNEGRVRVSSTLTNAHSGSYSLFLDDSIANNGAGSYSFAAIILTANLAGQTDVTLDFWWREFGEEFTSDDGVFISADYGATWKRVFIPSSSLTFQNQTIDIDQEAANNGLTLNDRFKIKFQFYDNWPINVATAPTNSDGYSYDDIALNCVDPQLDISKTVSISGTAPVQPGDPITYTIVISNNNINDGNNVRITDTLPTYISGSNLDETITVTAGQSVTHTINGTVSISGPLNTIITNTAYYNYPSGSGQKSSVAFTTIASTTETSTVTPGSSQTINTSDTILTLEIPSTTLPTTATKLIYTRIATPTVAAPTNAANLIFTLELVDASSQVIPSPTFTPPITVTIHYDENQLPLGSYENNLGVVFYNPDTGKWEEIDVVSQDTANNTLTILLTHLTEFALTNSSNVYLPIILKNDP